ncbi:hypothetical protein HYH03_009858 [Edaphochlamys debaryana]|uniref:Uncharacterized protein n=1 Tax=Edaphochlamys debaryana TaxID=47281 RepID=A0A836BXD4_9CHLO|nr:hypothetical protein HYH03_009858 [Edaphochlamys debaryana]|eukprot:KAG2491907.1 hypothetical protein HYH03_009858 [Edaphochlamys debaryana]
MEVKPKRVSLAPQRTPKARPARVSGGGSAGATARHGSLALGQNDKKLLTVLLGVLAVTTLLLYVFRGSARRQQDTIFVALGAYRDRKCTDTLTDLFRKADRPELISVGAVSFTVPGNTSSSELCEGSQLAPFEPSIRRLALSHLDAKGPFVARSHSASLYGGERYVLQIDSHVVFAPGWDTELLRMLRSLRSPKPLLTTYPAAVTGLDETRVPVLCVAFWRQPSGLLRLGTVLEPQPYRNQYKPVPFATGGLMFARADVLAEVPYDPTLEYLFHGDDALYSPPVTASPFTL